MATYAEQLAEVQAAISKALGAQSYEIGTGGSSRRVQRADLAALEARERRLIPLAAQEARGRGGRRTRQIAPSS
jgi:hypothetical protein